MNHLPLIIKREYLTKVKNKSFIVMTILSPMIMIVLIAVVAYLSQLNNTKERTISILDESGLVENIFVDSETTKYVQLENISLENAKTLVQEKDDYGLLYISDLKSDTDNFLVEKSINLDIEFYSKESPSLTLISALESKLEKQLTNLNLERNGVDLEMIKASKSNINISQENFSGEKTSKIDSIVKLIFGGAAGYLLFMFIIIYGNMIMRSVIEEKTSRIIEVIISSVKPIQLMLGKIIGTSLAGITQFVIWIILGSVFMMIISTVFGIDLMQTQSAQQEVIKQTMENPAVNMEVQNLIAAFYNLPIANLILAF